MDPEQASALLEAAIAHTTQLLAKLPDPPGMDGSIRAAMQYVGNGDGIDTTTEHWSVAAPFFFDEPAALVRVGPAQRPGEPMRVAALTSPELVELIEALRQAKAVLDEG